MCGLAEVPVFREQVEKDALPWVCMDDIFIELDAQPWSLGQREISIYYFWIARRGGLYPLVGKIVEMFLNFEVGCRSRKMQSSRC